MTKRGLVLSGGGALGAYEVGALEALIKAGRRYDVAAGVSVGAINATAYSFLSGMPLERIQTLKRIWQSIDNDTVFKKHAPWFFNYIWSFWKQSLYSMKPLEQFVGLSLDRDAAPGDETTGRYPGPRAGNIPTHLGVVNINTGRYHTVDVQHLGTSTLHHVAKVIHASCVFPGLFEPVELKDIPGIPDGLYVDGGIRDTVPLRAVIEDVDEVDVIITSTESGGVPYQHKFKSAVDVGLRAAFIMSDEVMVTDRIQAYCGHHDVKVNIYAPNAPLRFDGFEFTQDAIGEMLIQGYDETKAKLKEEKE